MHQIPGCDYFLKNSRKKVGDSPQKYENRHRLSYDGRRLSTDHRENPENWRSQVVAKRSTTQCDWAFRKSNGLMGLFDGDDKPITLDNEWRQ